MLYTVERLGQKGDGLVRAGDIQLHVPKVLAGEDVDLEMGKLTRVVTPSPERIAPFCPHYDRCGGCKFQHWAEAPYQNWKRNLLVEALAAQNIKTEVEPLVDAHGAGRRRVSLHVRQVGGLWRAGFMEQKSHDLIALDECPVLVPALRQAADLAAAFGPSLGACDVAVTAADNGLDVSIKAERKIVLRRLEALNDIIVRFGLLRLSVNGEVHTAKAIPHVTIGKAQVTLPTTSFLQATALGETTLAMLVLDAVKSAKYVADLFCGVGPFALRIAEKAKVYAADSDKPAIAAVQLAVRNTQGLKPVDAQYRDLFREPLTPMELKSFDAVVLDPPRAGAEAQARQLAKSQVKRVVLVSCDIANFARDAAILTKGGYSLKTVTPVDQFKWTAHLEMVGVFTR
jgi:23S rRNA (uracil1939-C5)-methyltransferase